MPVRIRDITLRNTLPVRLFAVEDLADVVVLAGPNGVGKTRLLERLVLDLRNSAVSPDLGGVIEATSKEESDTWEGKTTLDLADGADMAHLQKTLQVNRRRRNWRSSLVNIESDRTIAKLKPFAFTWDYPDPEEEEVPWESTMGFMRDRFQDTVHSMFKMIETQKKKIANAAIDLRIRQGRDEMKLTFGDPMEPFKEVFYSLLAPKELVSPSAQKQSLEYLLEGQRFDFQTLSSGEKEVVNVSFDFLLRKPRDCIVFFDEPELHLHPELSYRLIQTLQQIGSNNQFIFSTHSPNVITASLDRSVIFLAPLKPDQDESEPENQAIPVTEEDDTHQALKLLGQSIGIIALGRRIVLIEGEHSSLDKQTYGSIIGNSSPGLVLVPSGGKHVIESFSAVYDAVLSNTIWGVDFFMLCDGDSAPAASPDKAKAAREGGRLRVLAKYHLENYFLDEHVWAEAFAAIEPEGSWMRSPKRIRDVLREAAQGLASYATALAVTSRLRLAVGGIDVMPKECQGKDVDEIATLLTEAAARENARVGVILDEDGVRERVNEVFDGITKSLKEDTNDWKALIPGKPLLGALAGKTRLATSRMKTMYLQAERTSERTPFAEITDIFRIFAEA